LVRSILTRIGPENFEAEGLDSCEFGRFKWGCCFGDAKNGGEAGIRTLGRFNPSLVFKT